MDFRLSQQDLLLQQEARDFVRREWLPLREAGGWDDMTYLSPFKDKPEALRALRAYEQKLAARGWWTMHWPKEFGGKQVPVSMQMAYVEAMAYEGSPAWLGGDLVAPLLMFHGSDWQKREFLPRIARAEIDFAQGFSEPNAGSDLASLQTRAVREGDDYVVNGQKIWTSAAHYGEWYHVLVRTDPNAPKHRGISYVLMQLRDEKGDVMPGITLRPLYDMTGTRRWSEVFFDNVRVPVRNLIGEENRGWYAAMTTLSFERSGIEIPARLLGQLERFIEYCREVRVNGTPLISDPLARHRLADLRVEIEARRMLSYRVVSMQAAGLVPVKEASMAEAWGQELNKGFPVVLTRMLQERGLLSLTEPRAPFGGLMAHEYLTIPAKGMGGGTTEVQRNIVAQRGLGLPR